VLAYYKENIQLYIMLALWVGIGAFGGPAIYVVMPLMLILMLQKGMFEELFIGYLFVLILSDSLEERLFFAKSVKNIYAALLAVHFFFRTGEFNPLNRLYWLFIPFFLFAVVTMMTSITDPFFLTSFQKTLSYFLSFLILPNYIEKLYREEGVAFFRRFIFFCLTTLLLGFALKYLAHGIAYLETGRYRGVMGNPNGLGIYTFMLFVIFFILDDVFPELFSKQERILMYGAIFLSIYMTNSRSAVIAVAIFYVFQRFYSTSPFLGFLLFGITLYVVEIISTHIGQIIIALGLGNFFRIKTLEDASGRYIAWNFAWQQIQKNFFVGKGFAYNEYYMRQHYRELSKMGHQGGIHNSFLTFWMDQGLVGLLLFLRSFILLFIKAAKKTKFSYPVMFAISFTAMFESWLVGSLSAYAFFAMFIFTMITSDLIISSGEPELKEELVLN